MTGRSSAPACAPYDAAMRERLLEQDCLTTLIELDPVGHVGGGHRRDDRLPVEMAEDNAPLIAAMADPAIRIVALTVTEGGYYLDTTTKRASTPAHPDIRHDADHPDRPRTAFGAMVAALRAPARGRAWAHSPASAATTSGQWRDPAPDRGVARPPFRPRPRRLDRRGVQRSPIPWSTASCRRPARKSSTSCASFGIDDAAPVTHENYRQWVIEDAFCAGRPDWDRVGAVFTPRVHDYETMKIRILNGGHQIVSNAGEVLSVEYISGCMAHPLIAAFFRKAATEEIAPHVAPVPDMTPEAYVALIERRFSNPEIVDTVRRVAFDGSSRHTGFILPVIREALKAGAPIDGLALTEALWARMCEGVREDGSVIEANDPAWDRLTLAALAAKTDPRDWLNQREFYGDLADDARFAESFSRWLRLISSEGTEAALSAYLRG